MTKANWRKDAASGCVPCGVASDGCGFIVINVNVDSRAKRRENCRPKIQKIVRAAELAERGGGVTTAEADSQKVFTRHGYVRKENGAYFLDGRFETASRNEPPRHEVRPHTAGKTRSKDAAKDWIKAEEKKQRSATLARQKVDCDNKNRREAWGQESIP